MRNIVVTRNHTIQTVGLVALSLFLASTASVGLGQDSSIFQNSDHWEEPIDPRTEPAFQSDARLRDVFFLDASLGWACGDRGTVWSTQNGGATWTLQPTGSTASLNSIFFIDRLNGWAAGGEIDPYVWTTRGALLVTHDGGATWTENRRMMLPMIHKVRFTDVSGGWAVGRQSESYSSGYYRTIDGGTTWSSAPVESEQGWADADLRSTAPGVLLAQDGTAWRLTDAGAVPSETTRFGIRRLLALAGDGENVDWVVGEGGLALLSDDRGYSWKAPLSPLPLGATECFDFSAIAVGPNGYAWIAGAPGSRVFRTQDFGSNWESCPTGSFAPIRSMTFINPLIGWAVGDFGTILGTQDGGATWSPQRSGGTRAAILGLFPDANDVPMELITLHSGNEGYLSVIEVLGRRDIETPPLEDVSSIDRLHEAMLRCGGCGAERAWRFPLRQEGLAVPLEEVARGWDSANDGQGVDRFREQLVRAIRMWRPETILMPYANVQSSGAVTGSSDQLDDFLGAMILQAVTEAADPTIFSDQISQAGLEVWTVKRIHGVTGPGFIGELTLDSSELAIRLGRSIEDASAEANALLELDPAIGGPLREMSQTIGVETLLGETPVIPARPNLLAGLDIPAGGEARRRLTPSPISGLENTRRIARERRNLRAVIRRSALDPQQGLQMMGQIGDLIDDFDVDASARVLADLAAWYHMTGQWDMAADTHTLLLERCPRHPLAAASYRWLILYYASDEARWRMHSGNIPANGVSMVDQFRAEAADALSADPLSFDVQGGSGVPPQDAAGRSHQALQYGAELQMRHPYAWDDPRVQFPLAIAARRIGNRVDSSAFYISRAHSAEDDAWRLSASAEQWLDARDDPCPKPLLGCSWTTDRPFLDGRLNESFWGTATSVGLSSPLKDDDEWPARAMFSRDAQHLYFAFQCKMAEGLDYAETEEVRQRDPEQAALDRIDFMIDIDRDYSVFYRFTIDHRGWASESVWNDSSWDPDWFVAVLKENGWWTIEAAVPFGEMTGVTPGSGECWAVGVQRTVPGVGLQSWNRPARQVIQPEGFGYMVFE